MRATYFLYTELDQDACCREPCCIVLPSVFTINTSGCFCVSHTGGAGVGVHMITLIPFLCASSTALSIQAKSNFPSSGSKNAQANSPKCVKSKPTSAIFFKSLAQYCCGHCSG